MEAALGWFGDIVRALLRLIPQVILVRSTYAGVKFRYGRDVLLLTHKNGMYLPRLSFWAFLPYPRFQRTGIHFYWPLVTEHEIVPIKRQTANLVAQYLDTKDRKSIGCSGILVYDVSDVVKLLTECYDYEDTIRDYALAAIKDVIIQHTYDDMSTKAKEIDHQLTKTLRDQLKRFGIKTIRVTLSDFTQARIFGLWGVGGSDD